VTTVLVWLLVSLPVDWDRNRKPTVVVERFATAEECERVKKAIGSARPQLASEDSLLCIKATIAKVSP